MSNILSKYLVDPFSFIKRFDLDSDGKLSKREINEVKADKLDNNTKNLLNELKADNFQKYNLIASLSKDPLTVRSGFLFWQKEEIEDQLSREDIQEYESSKLFQKDESGGTPTTAIIDSCGNNSHGEQTKAIAAEKTKKSETTLLCMEDDSWNAVNFYLQKILDSPTNIKYINLSLDSPISKGHSPKELADKVNKPDECLKLIKQRLKEGNPDYNNYKESIKTVELLEELAAKGTKIYIAAGNFGEGSLNMLALAKGVNVVGGIGKDNKPAEFNSSTSLITSYENPYLKGELVKEGDNVKIKYEDLDLEIAFGEDHGYDEYFKTIGKQEIASEKDLNDYAKHMVDVYRRFREGESLDEIGSYTNDKLVKKDDLVNFLKNYKNSLSYPPRYSNLLHDLENFETEYVVLGEIEDMVNSQISIKKSEKGFALFREYRGTSFASPRQLKKEREKAEKWKTINDFPSNKPIPLA